MTTGKIEYSPDYRSPKKRYPDMSGVFKGMALTAQRRQLEQKIVKKARAWARAILGGAHAQIAADNELRDAVDALESFESEQKK